MGLHTAYASAALALAILVLGLIGGAWAVGASYDNVHAPLTNTTETTTADFDAYVQVAPTHADTVYDNETVTNSTGTALTEGTDYEWNASDGSLLAHNTSNVSSGETLTVDFAYRTKPVEARSLQGVYSVLFTDALPHLVWVVPAMGIVGLAVWIGSKANSSAGGLGR